MIIKTLRHKLLLAFLSIFLITLLAFLGSIYIYNQKSHVTDVIRNIDEIRVLALKNFKLVDDFLTYEVENENYFFTKRSKVKQEFESNYRVILAGLSDSKTQLSGYPVLCNLIDSIRHQQMEYRNNFNVLEQLILKKGFKDYGIEGLMRVYAHRLMETKYHSVRYATLMLRRHEKDFIIRKDAQYFNKFLLVFKELQAILNKKNISISNKKELMSSLLDYRCYFVDYFNVQYEIGTTENEGYLFKLNKNYQQIDKLFDSEKFASIKLEEQFTSTLKYYNVILISISVILSLFFSFAYSFQISNHTVKLKNNIENYVNSGFKEWPKFDKSIKIKELVVIAKGFNKMAVEINSYLNFFKVKVEERTLEITKQKEELQQQGIKIQIQHDLLLEHKNMLEKQQFLLSEKNQGFTDSVKYAERIQKAILPPFAEFKKEFSDSFIFYAPKDIVSGDFYWLDTVLEEKEIISEHELSYNFTEEENMFTGIEFRNEPSSKKLLFAVADCTGHGVPGAFMSIVGSNHLNKIVKEHQIHEPSEVLTHLNNEIMSTFRQDNREPSTIKDGMEIAFCSYDTGKNTLHFSGANKTLYLVRDEIIHEFKGNRKPIGAVDEKLQNLKFTTTEIKISRGDRIYLFTDGYNDQFGGPKNKKFKAKNFKGMLLQTSIYSMSEQFSLIKKNFGAWKGDTFQVDDVLVMGLEF